MAQRLCIIAIRSRKDYNETDIGLILVILSMWSIYQTKFIDLDIDIDLDFGYEHGHQQRGRGREGENANVPGIWKWWRHMLLLVGTRIKYI